MIEAVIFDMDGVLVDSEKFHDLTVKETLNDIGINLTEEERNQFRGVSSIEMWQTLKDRFNFKQNIKDIIGIRIEKFLKTVRGKIKNLPGAESLVKELNGKLRLAIASSSHMRVVSSLTEETGIKNYFNIIVSGEHIENSKPSPDIFLEAAKRMGVESEKCVVIEDAINGVIAAKKAGMKCIGVTNSFPKEKLSDADLIVNSLEELNYDKIMKLGG